MECNLAHRAGFPQKVAGVDDEDLLLAEMGKCVALCRPCHDKVHKAEKKIKNARAFRDYIENLRRQDGAWLDVDKIAEYAKLAPT